MNLSGAYERLDELLAQTGLVASDELRERLQGAMEPLIEWLNESSMAHLRALQVLLLSPDKPNHRRPEVLALSKVVQERWKTAATSDGLGLLQLVLLASWTRAEYQPLPALLRTAVSAERRPAHHQGMLDEVWDIVGDYVPASPIPMGLSPAQEGAVVAALDAILAHPGNANVLAAHASAVLRGFRDAIAILWPYHSSAKPECSTLLWWGQARYSTTQRRSLRHFTAAERLTIAALEVCALSTHLPFNPTAAYLVEVLHALGDAWDETRPLRAWLDDLHATQKLIGPLASNPSEGGATALPSLTLLAGTPVEDLGDKCQIDLDTPYTRADWATWLLGELTLARVLAP
jgi:hypothetical protein